MWQDVLCQSSLVVSVSSLLIMLVFKPLAKNAILMSRSILSASHAVALLLARDDSVVDEQHDAAAAAPPRRHCEQCAARGGARLSRSDAAAVLASLGLLEAAAPGGRCRQELDDGLCGGCEAMGVVEELAESKVAGEGELREAFGVFDRDEDGYVCAAELWNVMRRLGMREGARYEDCARMIAAHDRDGDGRVSFTEFRAMMENAL